MDETNGLATIEQLNLGSLAVQPSQVVARASKIAGELAAVIRDRKLYTTISGRNYVRVDGWTTLGAMLGVTAREVSVTENEGGDIEAVVELVRVSDGAVIGRGSAILGTDENTWRSRPHYARRSMAITRATGKAFRLCFSWIISLAGYETTPAEEMDGLVEAEFKPISHNRTPSQPNENSTENKPAVVDPEALAFAESELNSKGEKYGDLPSDTLSHMARELEKKIKAGGLTEAEAEEKGRKLTACRIILKARAK